VTVTSNHAPVGFTRCHIWTSVGKNGGNERKGKEKGKAKIKRRNGTYSNRRKEKRKDKKQITLCVSLT